MQQTIENNFKRKQYDNGMESEFKRWQVTVNIKEREILRRERDVWNVMISNDEL